MATKRGNRRAVTSMFEDVAVTQRDEEIERLRQELEAKSKNTKGKEIVEIPVHGVQPLQIELDKSGDLSIQLKQPRSHFDLDKLADLKRSIEANGLNEPIIVRQLKPETWGLIDGERRWRCYLDLGLDTIPAIVHEAVSDHEALERSLISHCLKEQASPLEQTIATMNLLRLRLGADEEQVRKLLVQMNNAANGKSAKAQIAQEQIEVVTGVLNSLGLQLGSLVTARLPMLDLPINLRQAVEGGALSPTNAVLIARTPEQLHQQLIDQGSSLSKRALQNLISELKATVPAEVEEPKPVVVEASNRLKAISRSRFMKNGGDSEANRRLQKISKLLTELEEYIAERKK